MSERIVHFYFSNSGDSSNTPGRFKNKLATPLLLEGDWEVGLVEAHIPNTWWTLFNPIVIKCFGAVEELKPGPEVATEEEGFPEKRLGRVVRWEIEMPRRHYDTEFQLATDFEKIGRVAMREQLTVGEYNSILPRNQWVKPRFSMDYYPTLKKFQINSDIKYAALLVRSGIDVLESLGFEPVTGVNRVANQYTKFEKRGENSYTAHFGNLGAFLIYWDAIAYSVVGEAQAPVFAVVLPSCELNNEFSTRVQFTNPVFHRVTKSYINEVEFAIFNSAGKEVNFRNLGHTTLIVEYRKVGWRQQQKEADILQ